MKIAIPVDDQNQQAPIAAQFGRSKYFAIYNSTDDKQEIKYITNKGAQQARGAGFAATQTLVDNHIDRIFVNNLGPNAQRALQQAGIQTSLTDKKSVEEIIKDMK